MTKQEMLMRAIEQIGYEPQVDSDGDVLVCYQLKNIYFMIGDEDEPFVTAVFPSVSEIEEGEEAMALAVCNKMNREMKLVKVYLHQNYKTICANCEFYYTDENSLQHSLENSLRVFGILRSTYNRFKCEVSE